MDRVLAHVVEPERQARLASEGTLRVAAETLSRLGPGIGTATTVVGVLGADDVDAFKRLVTDIADEYGLDASVQIHVGSYSVRFSGTEKYAWTS